MSRDESGTSRNEFGVFSRQNALAEALGVPSNRIHAIVNVTRRITADTDLRLCRFLDYLTDIFSDWRMLTDLWRLNNT